jgi:hypothetical protein
MGHGLGLGQATFVSLQLYMIMISGCLHGYVFNNFGIMLVYGDEWAPVEVLYNMSNDPSHHARFNPLDDVLRSQ